MKAYSLDLRERVAAACQQPGRNLGAVAAQFSVSVSFVEKFLQRQRTSGSLAPLPLRGGNGAPSCGRPQNTHSKKSRAGPALLAGRAGYRQAATGHAGGSEVVRPAGSEAAGRIAAGPGRELRRWATDRKRGGASPDTNRCRPSRGYFDTWHRQSPNHSLKAAAEYHRISAALPLESKDLFLN